MTTRIRRSVGAISGLTLALSACAVSGTESTRPSAHAPVPAKVALAPALAPVSAEADERPNIFLITVDDGATGDIAHMPHVRRLIGKRGVTMTNAIAPTPLCVPARATLLTGQYAHNHGALGIRGAHGGFRAFDDEDTLPVWLQEAGYDTFLVGKYLNGYGATPGSRAHVPPGWTGWNASLDPATYRFFRTAMNRDGRVVRDRGYNTDTFADRVATTLSAPARAERPWYMWVSYVAPHNGLPDESGDPRSDTRLPRRLRVPTTTPARRHANTFKRLRLPSRPDMFTQPSSSHVRGTRTRWSAQGKAVLTEVFQQRIESLQAVDEAVGRHLRLLKKTDQLDNTLVVFTSDNGYNVGEHNLLGKLWFFDPSLEVPMAIRGPGVPRGATSPSLVTLADLPVTFADLAGVRPGRDVDGSDLLGLIADPQRGRQRVIPIEAWPVRARSTERLYSGIRVGRSWTYVKVRGDEEELYDLRKDPFMLHNVAGLAAYSSQLSLLRQLDERHRDCAGETCPQP